MSQGVSQALGLSQSGVGNFVGIYAADPEIPHMLTDSQIRSGQTCRPRTQLFDGGGLYLHIKPTADATAVQLPVPGTGEDPGAWHLSRRAARGGEGASSGRPAAAQRRNRSAAKKQISITTFETVAREWYARWKPGRNQQYAFYVLKRLETDIFPAFGGQPISEVPALCFPASGPEDRAARRSGDSQACTAEPAHRFMRYRRGERYGSSAIQWRMSDRLTS